MNRNRLLLSDCWRLLMIRRLAVASRFGRGAAVLDVVVRLRANVTAARRFQFSVFHHGVGPTPTIETPPINRIAWASIDSILASINDQCNTTQPILHEFHFLGRHDAAKQQRKINNFVWPTLFWKTKQNKTNFVRKAQVSEINNFETVIFAVEKFLAAAHKLANSTMYLSTTWRPNGKMKSNEKNTTSWRTQD